MKQSAYAGWPESLLEAGEIGARILEFEWSKTPAGPIDAWPPTLRAFVGTILAHDFPMYIFWGEHDIAIYNQAYALVAGDKHPSVLGMATRDAWPEAWTNIAPLLARVKDGETVTIKDFELTLVRFGFSEQFFHTVCYSPLRDDSGAVCGALATFTETTAEVLGRRRLETLRRVASTANPTLSEKECLRALVDALADDPDVPVALLYLAQNDEIARLETSVGRWNEAKIVPQQIILSAIAHDCVEPVGARLVSPGFCGLFGEDDSRTIAAPICASPGGDPIGVLVVRLSDCLRLDQPYLSFVGLLASQIGVAIGAARLAESQRAWSESRLVSRTVERIGSLAESGRHLFWTARPDGWIDWYARGWYDYTGQGVEEATGWGWQSVHHPEDLPEVMRRWPESIATGEPFEMTFRLRRRDGRYRWFLTRAVPETDADGRIIRWYGTNTDIDEERRAARQLDAFARIGQRAAGLSTAKETVTALCEVLVPQFADWTLVNLAGPDGALTLVDARHADETKMRLLLSQVGQHYDLPSANSASQEVFRSGRPLLFENITSRHAYGRTQPNFAAVVAEVGLESAVVVPIIAAGHTLGTFHALTGGSGRTYEQRDLPFFEEIGRRIGAVLHNARLFERESRLAESFQNAALPSGLPECPGIRFSALYSPAGVDAKIGGDFHDAFRLLDGRVAVCIGDVAGTGLEAAATMAAVRQSIRAAASINPDPALMLKAADAVFSEQGRAPFATAFVGIIDPVTFSLQYANAGHPRPMLRSPDTDSSSFIRWPTSSKFWKTGGKSGSLSDCRQQGSNHWRNRTKSVNRDRGGPPFERRYPDHWNRGARREHVRARTRGRRQWLARSSFRGEALPQGVRRAALERDVPRAPSRQAPFSQQPCVVRRSRQSYYLKFP